MKKMVMLLLAAAALMVSTAEAGTKWGYFYLYQNQDVASNESVDWQQAGNLVKDVDDLYIDAADTTAIVLAKPGIYKVNFLLTANSESGALQFSLHLNDSVNPIPGSTSAIGNAVAGEEPQLAGEVFFISNDENAQLRLWNQSGDAAHLVNNVGTDDPSTWGNNVTAILSISRVSKLED